MLGPGGFPVGPCRIAAGAPQAQREAHRAAASEAGGRMMGEGIGAVPGVVVAVDVGNEPSHVCTQRSLAGEERLAAAPTRGWRLRPQEVAPAAMPRRLPPGGLRQNAGALGVGGALQDAAGESGQALRGQNHQAAQIVRNMPQRALVVTQVAEDRRGRGTTGAGFISGRSLTHPFVLVRVLSLAQGRIGGAAWQSTTVE
jgi:hypothetical protein